MERAAEPRPCFTRPPQELISPGGTGLPNDRENGRGKGALRKRPGIILPHNANTPYISSALWQKEAKNEERTYTFGEGEGLSAAR